MTGSLPLHSKFWSVRCVLRVRRAGELASAFSKLVRFGWQLPVAFGPHRCPRSYWACRHPRPIGTGAGLLVLAPHHVIATQQILFVTKSMAACKPTSPFSHNGPLDATSAMVAQRWPGPRWAPLVTVSLLPPLFLHLHSFWDACRVPRSLRAPQPGL